MANLFPPMNWIVYMVQCRDGSFYTGITIDLPARLSAHNAGVGAKYTRGRLPVTLVWSEKGFTQSQARKREHAIKQLSRKQKALLM
jgi:putative endonuclease